MRKKEIYETDAVKQNTNLFSIKMGTSVFKLNLLISAFFKL